MQIVEYLKGLWCHMRDLKRGRTVWRVGNIANGIIFKGRIIEIL